MPCFNWFSKCVEIDKTLRLVLPYQLKALGTVITVTSTTNKTSFCAPINQRK